MTPTRRHALAAALALGLTALTGCTSSGPNTTTPTSSAPTQGTPTPTPTTTGPAVVGRATSAAEAIRDANASLIGYYTASFESGHAGGTRLDLVTPWTTGTALQNERALATYLQQKHYRLDGTPTAWTLNPSHSSTARTQASGGGGTIDFGLVHLVGCARSTNHPVGDKAPAWTTKGKQFARGWSLVYDVRSQHWIVSAADPLTESTARTVSCS